MKVKPPFRVKVLRGPSSIEGGGLLSKESKALVGSRSSATSFGYAGQNASSPAALLKL